MGSERIRQSSHANRPVARAARGHGESLVTDSEKRPRRTTRTYDVGQNAGREEACIVGVTNLSIELALDMLS